MSHLWPSNIPGRNTRRGLRSGPGDNPYRLFDFCSAAGDSLHFVDSRSNYPSRHREGGFDPGFGQQPFKKELQCLRLDFDGVLRPTKKG
jgi:hypothetical protein